MFQLETSACIDALEEICRQPEMDFGFVGPGDLAMSLGLATRDSFLGYMKADELKWCFSYIVETCTAAGKIAGGFTRGGDPSTLLSHGFAMVALSHDLMDAMAGAQSIMTGAVRVGGVPVKTAPGLTRLKKWSRNASKLVPTAGFIVLDGDSRPSSRICGRSRAGEPRPPSSCRKSCRRTCAGPPIWRRRSPQPTPPECATSCRDDRLSLLVPIPYHVPHEPLHGLAVGVHRRIDRPTAFGEMRCPALAFGEVKCSIQSSASIAHDDAGSSSDGSPRVARLVASTGTP